MTDKLKAATLKEFLKDIRDDAEMEFSLHAIVDGEIFMWTISQVTSAKIVKAC
jgi:hypothetical protein